MGRKKAPKSRCPCCNYKTLPQKGEYSICPVCFWENDGTRDPEDYSSPNHMTLAEGRRNFAEFGACDQNGRLHVRDPQPDEI